MGDESMSGFFRGWRRKTGSVLLVIACIAFVGFVRSYYVWDRLFFRAGRSMHIITSFDGQFSWTLRRASGISIEWPIFLPEWKTRMAEEGRRFLATDIVPQRSLPYWLFTPLITLAAVFLLSWNPRKHSKQESPADSRNNPQP